MRPMPAELLVLSLAILAAPATTRAATVPVPAPADTAVYRVPPVIVEAARPGTTAGGASAIVVALDSSSARPAPTLEQVLRAMPLVVIRANSRGEAQPALRGGEDRQIAVLVDGVPITLAWDHRSDLSVIPLTAARSVTVHRGFSSLLMGPNALAGAVEVDVARGSRAAAPTRPLVVDAGVDHDGSRSAALTAGWLRADDGGHWLLRAGGGYRGSDGFVLPHGLADGDAATTARMTADGDRRLNTDHEAFDGFLALRRASSSGAWASLTGAGYRAERGVAPEAHTSDPRLWRYPFQARAFGALSAGTGMRATPWGRGDLEASLGTDAGRTEIDEFDGLDYRTVVGGERHDDRTLTARLIGDHTVGARGDLRMALTLAEVSHDEVLGTDPSASYRQRLSSLASETEWRLGFGVPVRFSLGGAADGTDTPESADKPALDRLWDWAGRIGATASFHDGSLVVNGSSGRRARFPALRELYSGALGRFLENPDLGPEVQWVSELGLTVNRTRGNLQLIGFHQVLEDAITRISVATPSGNRFQRVNLGRITAQGIEAVGRLVAGAFTVGADATVQSTRALDASGDEVDLEYEPAAIGRVWAEAPLAAGVRVAVVAHGTGEQRFIDLDSGSPATLSPGARLDVSVSRGFELRAAGAWRHLELLVAAENLADQAVFDQAGLPQPGRTVRLQARLW